YNIGEYLSQRYYQKRLPYYRGEYVAIPNFNWFDGNVISQALAGTVGGIQVEAKPAPVADSAKEKNIEEVVVLGYKTMAKKTVVASDVALDGDDLPSDKIPVRKNLNETAFFYPDLKTDAEGNVSFEFTSPEALTKWKLMFL